jgi:hypothetical protein
MRRRSRTEPTSGARVAIAPARENRTASTRAMHRASNDAISSRGGDMPVKPSSNEEEYFARLEVERRKKAAEERQAQMATEERERERALHHMKCPKCGMTLEEMTYGGVVIDKCFGCGGFWLDEGELETIQKKESGFVGQMLRVFRSDSGKR